MAPKQMPSLILEIPLVLYPLPYHGFTPSWQRQWAASMEMTVSHRRKLAAMSLSGCDLSRSFVRIGMHFRLVRSVTGRDVRLLL